MRQERKGALATLGILVRQVQQVPQVREQLDLQVPQETAGQAADKEQLALQDRLDQQDQLEERDQPELPAQE